MARTVEACTGRVNRDSAPPAPPTLKTPDKTGKRSPRISKTRFRCPNPCYPRGAGPALDRSSDAHLFLVTRADPDRVRTADPRGPAAGPALQAGVAGAARDAGGLGGGLARWVPDRDGRRRGGRSVLRRADGHDATSSWGRRRPLRCLLPRRPDA